MKNKIFLKSSLTVKGVEQESKSLKIAGYANTTKKDRSGDVIMADAWRKGLDNFAKNSVLLLQHDQNQPIGTVTSWRVDDGGLHIEAEVSSAAEELYKTQTLIRDGALKTFSVGFIPKKGRKDTASNTLYITEVELLEVSVVSIPANQDSIFSIVKSLQKEGDYEKFLAENVEFYDSTKEEKKVEMSEADIVIPAAEEPTVAENKEVATELVSTIANKPEEETTVVVKEVERNLFWNAIEGKKNLKLDSKNFTVSNVDTKNDTIDLQEISILGNPIGEILKIDINTLNILNLMKVDTSDHVVLKTVDLLPKEEIEKQFADLVKAEIQDLKTILTDGNLPKLAKQQLSYTIDLMEKPIKNWNSDDYIVANKIVDYILSRSQLEAEDVKTLLMLHGHVEETKEMNPQNPAVDSEEISQVPATAAISVSQPMVEKLVDATGSAMSAVEDAREANVPASALKALEERVEQLMAEVTASKAAIAANHQAKMAYAVNNSTGESAYKNSDVLYAAMLAHAKNPGQPLTLKSFKEASALGADILRTKATITNVPALITDFTTAIQEQMQIELKVANMLNNQQVNAQKFTIPVSDEDTGGDIAMFANGTYNLGESDSTRVPTSRQNTIVNVDLTPHKFMGTTHVAKDEQEDVIIPLLQWQVKNMVRRMARSVDKSLLRGDGSLSGFTAAPSASVVNNTGMASVITGIAQLAYNISGLRVSTGGTSTKATPTSIATARATMGRYGLEVGNNNLVYFTSIEGYNELVTTSDFRTVDKIGIDRATYITGQVGAIYGIPVIISEFLDNVGSSGNIVGLLVYLPNFLVGTRRAMDMESQYDPRRQLTAVYISTRFDMKALTTNANAALDATKYSTAVAVHSA